MVKKQLDSCLQLSILGKLADSAGSSGVLVAVDAASIRSHSGDIVLEHLRVLDEMTESCNSMCLATEGIRGALRGIETSHEVTSVLFESEEKNLDKRAFSKGLL